ncbi:hypothetical protein PENTCL1PPCAC_7509, partial [Pristionchus entomophagus]
EVIIDKARRRVSIKENLLRELLAELGATFLLVFLGLCNVAQFVLTQEKVNSWVSVNIGWGLIITFCIYTAARTSGAHMNPAISFMIYTFGHLPLKKFLLYSLMQFIGAFFGSAAMYAYYSPLFTNFDNGVRSITGNTSSAMVFCSYPAPHIRENLFAPFVDQFVGTAVLAFMICVVCDDRNEIPKYLRPLLVGLSVVMIGTCFAVNLGYPINPARDLGPRLFSAFIYGAGVFHTPSPFFWIAPVIGPMFGAPAGGWFYYLVFGFHLPPKSGDVYRIIHNYEINEVK